MSSQAVNLLDLNPMGLTAFLSELGEKPFRAKQILSWIHKKGVVDFDCMTDLSHALRNKLKAQATIQTPKLLSEQLSTDGTRKWLFCAEGNAAIETVFIPESHRGTLCVSSQVGCALNCKFCHTAQQGYQRNLKPSEIIGQLWYAVHTLRNQPLHLSRSPITNVVFMGMGEPLLNYDHVLTAIQIMQNDLTYGLSKRRVTISTSGVVPYINRLVEDTDIALAVSLHAPNDLVRTKIMPINKKYPLSDLLASCKNYIQKNKRRKVTMEYVMLAGMNDQPHHAIELVKLLKNIPSKINLIPFNPFPGTSYECSSMQTIKTFQAILMQHGFIATIRKTRGEDIDAACGQLSGRVIDRTKRSIPYVMERKYQLPVVVSDH